MTDRPSGKFKTTIVAGVKAYQNRVKDIPPERLAVKVRRTFLGTVFVAGSVGAGLMGWPWYIAAGSAIFGAHIISADLTGAATKFLLGVVKELLAAVKGAKTE